MRTFLSHNTESGVLQLIMTDYYRGQHERTAYTVVNGDNLPLRNRPDMDGATVYGSALTRDLSGWHVKAPGGGRIPVRTMPDERAETERTPCPRYLGKSRKCETCTAEGALIP